jgi:hypothetical protein
MWAIIWGYVKRFWWVLALVGVALFLWLRGRLREAERAAVIRKQLDIEIQLRNKIQSLDVVSREARRKHEQEVEAGRAELEVKKQILETSSTADANYLADAWNRAFGPRRASPTTPH